MKIWRQEDWTALSGEADKTAAAVSKAEQKVQIQNTDSGFDANEAKAAKEKAVYYLQFSSKTESELRKKLAEQEFSPASIEYAIQFVKEHRYLDDEDYTRRYIERNGRKKSRKQMIFELSQKGVAREIVDLVFEDMTLDEETQILAILAKKNYAGEESDWETKQKIAAYLARKGFSYDAIMSAMHQFAGN